jgi:hypothetical protein
MPDTAAYVYCIVKSAKKPSASKAPSGLPGAAPPQARDAGRGLWCVLAQVPLAQYGADAVAPALSDMTWVSDVALGHESVVEHFARQRGATTIPMKMFTMFSTPERAIADVRARRRQIEAVAKRIAGCEEWGVRVTRRPGEVPVVPEAERPRSGAAFLDARRRARDAARERARGALEAAEAVFDRLAALASAASRRDDAPAGATSPPMLDAAFLVRSTGRARFKAAARRASAECEAAGAELTLTGPWPAYNFVREPRGARS